MKRRWSIAGWVTVPRVRIAVLFLLMVAAAGVLIRVLYREQVEAGEAHVEAVRRQSIRRTRAPARRGMILTSDHVVVAENRMVRNLVFYPQEMRLKFKLRSRIIENMREVSGRIAAVLGRENTLTDEQIKRHLNTSTSLPLVVFSDLDDRETVLALEVSRQLPGVDIEVGEARKYPLGDFAPHLIGHTRMESPREAADRKDFFYYIPDPVGRSGIEAWCDSPEWAKPAVGLRGTPGYAVNLVDYLGYVQEVRKREAPTHGNNVVLTLDSRAQKLAEKLLNGQTGAIVVVDADNGDVLAAATAPRYDLNRFSPKLSAETYRQLREDPGLPLLNRAFQGSYTPGSILKPVVAMALLESGVDPAEELDCTGATEIGNASIRCASYRRGGHGMTDLRRAIEWSCNCYFNQMGMRVGEEQLFRALRSAGIGERTGIELAEAPGIMPSHELKLRRGQGRWNRFDTALLSMGQGLVTVTPLQAALYAAAFCNGGTLWKPHLVRELVDQKGKVQWVRRPEVRGKLLLHGERLSPIVEGMFEVVNSPSGSGRSGAVEGLKICGKTGTAEIGSKAKRRQITWFIAVTECRGRRCAAAVMIEGGRSGGTDCAPLAARFFREYLLPPERN